MFKPLGKDGKYGEVYSARASNSSKRVCVKFVPFLPIEAVSTTASDPDSDYYNHTAVLKEAMVWKDISDMMLEPSVPPVAPRLIESGRMRYPFGERWRNPELDNDSNVPPPSAGPCYAFVNELCDGDFRSWDSGTPDAWASCIMQALMNLVVMQECLSFCHDDCHEGNLLFTLTGNGNSLSWRPFLFQPRQRYLLYEVIEDGNVSNPINLLVPFSGEQWKLADFGRSRYLSLHRRRSNMKLADDAVRLLCDNIIDDERCNLSAEMKSDVVLACKSVHEPILTNGTRRFVPAWEAVRALALHDTSFSRVFIDDIDDIDDSEIVASYRIEVSSRVLTR
jgi:hypothetical protein